MWVRVVSEEQSGLRLHPGWLLRLCEDREEHRDVPVVVGVAVDGDEVADAVLGRERGVVALQLTVVIREPPDADRGPGVVPFAHPNGAVLRRQGIPVGTVKHPELGCGP